MLNFKHIIILTLIICSQCFARTADQPVITVGVTQIVGHPALDATRKGIITTLQSQDNIKILTNEGEILTLKAKDSIKILKANAQNDMRSAAQIAQRFVGEGVRAIITISTPSTQAAMTAVRGTSIPIFFASITDPQAVHLVENIDHPEGQVTGCSNKTALQPQLNLFKEILPDLTSLGVLYSPGEINSVIMVQQIQDAARALNISVITAPINCVSEISAAAQQLLEQVDALFISNDNTALSALSFIVKVATAAHKPVFVSDTDLVKQGALAALGPNQFQVGVIAAEMLLEHLAGKPLSELAVRYPTQKEFHLNLNKARELDINIADYLINKADVKHDDKKIHNNMR